MRIATLSLAMALALASGLSQAQAYRWVDKDGKVRYGDVPPPGVKATTMKAPAGGAAPAAPAPGAGGGGGAASKDAKKGPMTAAEQEQAYRERQLKAKEAREDSEKKQAEAEQMRQACQSAQETLRSLERGSRISTVNAAGETVVLEDDQRAVRVAQAKKAIADTCK